MAEKSKKKSRRSEIKGLENLRKNPEDHKLKGRKI